MPARCCSGNAERLVEQVDHREVVVRADDLQIGGGQHQQYDDRGAEEDGEPAAEAAQPGQAAIAEPPQPRQQQQQCQVAGAAKVGW